MDSIWNILGLEPTRDVAAIKRAYARLAPQYHPEEDPEGFLRLREAYQKALAWTEDSGEPSDSPADSQPEQDGGWQINQESPPSGPNPYQEHEAVRQFRTLYTGNRRRDPKAWMDYFTSPPFLDVMREPDFTAILLAVVEESEDQPSKELETWLSIAYQFTSEEAQDENGQRGRRFRFMQGAAFDGVDPICQIAAKGPMPRRLQGNELAMFISFFEYNRLLSLAETSGWDDSAISEAGNLIYRYVMAYLRDKCTKREWNDTERHPAGLRLLEHFFRRKGLPEELYRVLWTKLDLKSAMFGRSAVLYKNLRELVLERVPGIGNEAPENFLELNKAHDAYRFWVSQHPEQDEEKSAAFFAREDFQKALRSRRFVEEQLLRSGFWLSNTRSDGFLRRLLAFYRENPGAPCAGQVVERVEQIYQEMVLQRWNEEDKAAPVGEPVLSNRPFLRHWLNTGFYSAPRHPDSGRPLQECLNDGLAYLPEWSRRFLSGPDGSITPLALSTEIGGAAVEIIYHLRYIEYKINGEAVYFPCLPWELLAEQGGDYFFHLLPITVTFYTELEEVRGELLRRLDACLPMGLDCGFLAGCLAANVCRLPEPESPDADPLASLPLELFAEDEERLYGAAWYEREGVLISFEQTFAGRRDLPGGQYDGIFDENTALSLARQLLDEAVCPKGLHLSLLKELPYEVFAHPHYAPQQVFMRAEDLEAELADEEDKAKPHKDAKPLTGEVLEDLLNQFAEKKLRRLELSWEWYGGSLVLLSDRSGYACLFFEHAYNTWYAMLSQPEIYRTVDHTDVQYIPFGMGKLPEYSVHQDTASIMRNLDLVFSQIGRGRPETRVGDRWLWSSNVNLHDGHHKYLMAKQKLGGFPPNRGRNYLLAKFVLSQYPVRMESLPVDGERILTDIKSGSYGMAANALVQFMQKKLARLRLTWQLEAKDGSPCLRHIVLLQDNGRFMMVWLRDDRQTAEYYVADVEAYMGVEGKKYPKDVFLGRSTPAYLIHQDLNRIRNCLDLMLDDMADTSPIINQFAQFASENPVARRPYAELRAELVVDD